MYVDAKSVERNDAYESFSAVCHPTLALSAFVKLLDETAVV